MVIIASQMYDVNQLYYITSYSNYTLTANAVPFSSKSPL